MNITTYNTDGTIKETKTINCDIPEYIERYDEQHSWLNITAEEIEIVNSKTNSFKKKVLLRRLKAVIEHDYKNFIEVSGIEIETLMMNLESLELSPNIIKGDKVLSSILRIYGYHPRYSNIKVFQGEDFFSEETCTKEEFLLFINKVEHQHTDEQGNVLSSNWINVLLYHAFKSAISVRLRYDDVDIEIRFFISLQNLINRYYYSLRNMERTVGWMPDELKHQMYVLSAFVKKVERHELFSINESLFYSKVINALYLSKEQHRSDMYRMMAIAFNYIPLLKDNKNGLHFCVKTPEKTVEKEYDVNFHDYKKQIVRRYGITDNDIFTLRVPSENTFLITLQNLLKKIYDQHITIYHDKWEGNVKTDADIFFNKLNPIHEDWSAFYNHEIEKYRPTNISNNKLFEPQDCFFFLLCDNIQPNKELMFTKDVVADLIELLIRLQCDSETGLYECMYKMNYIKKHISSNKPADEAKNKAMRYIGCLFELDCKLVMQYYRVVIKQLIEQILSLPSVYRKIAKITPNGFTGGLTLS